MQNLQAYHFLSLASFALLLCIFVYTGQVLQNEFIPKTAETETVRMMARADHIYIFYAACLNLVLGLWASKQSIKLPTIDHFLHWTSRLLLIASSTFPVISFFTQTAGSLEQRTLNLPGLTLLIASMLCLVLLAYREKK